MKLSEFAADEKVTSFSFVEVQLVPRRDGKKNAILTLAQPLANVVGSQKVKDPASGEELFLEQWDISKITVSAEDMQDDGIDWDKTTKTGTVACDMRLDVTQRGDVWLTSKSYADFANEARTERRTDRDTANFSRMAERRARVKLAGTDIPATTAANAARTAAKTPKTPVSVASE